MTAEAKKATKITFAEDEPFFPHASPYIREFLQLALAEGADELPFRVPRRFNIKIWERNVAMARAYWGDPAITLDQVAIQFNIQGSYKGSYAGQAIRALVVALYQNASAQAQEPINRTRRVTGVMPFFKKPI